MKVLITGANGLLGQKLVALFSKNKISFLATSRGEGRVLTKQAPYQALDVTDKAQVLKIVGSYDPDVIIHAAAMTQVDQCETDRERCWELNVQAVSNILEASSLVSAHLIHLSTDFIFDGTGGPYTESARPNPVNYYGESKWAAENLISESKVTWSIIRTVLVYGATPGLSRSNIMLWVKTNLEAGKTIQVVDDQFRTPTLAEDLAVGCLLIAQKGIRGVFNIAGKDLLTPYDIAQITAKYFDLDRSLIQRANSKTFKQPARRPLRTGFIIEKARRELGYDPHSFKEGLALTASLWGG